MRISQGRLLLHQSRWTANRCSICFPTGIGQGKRKGHYGDLHTNLDTVRTTLNGRAWAEKDLLFPRPGMVRTYGDFRRDAKACRRRLTFTCMDVPYNAGTLLPKE